MDAKGLEQLLNDILARVRSQKIMSGPNLEVRETAMGTTLAPKASVGGTAAVVQVKEFKFVRMFGDYMVVQDLVDASKYYQVARPFKHRNSITVETIYGLGWQMTYTKNTPTGSVPNLNFDPLAFISRKATYAAGNYFEFQRINPPYLANDIIRATMLSAPVANVVSVGPAGGDNTNDAGTPISWSEDNYDGRAWAVTPDGAL